jgi:acyl CoA:acetate/3-ketoacid CoA transferase alpha subunit/acyl CoA:acetate/3-ketoacid CoA transferase beta subunit
VTGGPAGGPDSFSLADAIERHVVPGDTVHVMLGHSRWTAAARELARQHWGGDPGFTLVMASLGAMSALFFEGGMLQHVVTAYSGDSFPTYTPNPIFRRAYEAGEVTVEHWSFLTLTQRLEAAARGLPAMVTGSLAGSSMAANPGYARVGSPFVAGDGVATPGTVGLVAPLTPDVALLHAAVADRHGNLALSEPLLEGVWGAWAAKRGVVATVERVVDNLDGLGHRVRIPAHRVLAVVEAPYGAHPGGCYAPGLPADSYGEDIPFWVEAAQAARSDFGAFARTYALDPVDHAAYLATLGPDRLAWLSGRSDPSSWKQDAEVNPVPVDEPISRWERAAGLAVREVERTVDAVGADAVLAGAGVANLAAWVAVASARAAGRTVYLTAELGLWGYEPTPADPYIFNHRVFPGTPYLSDASTVLGMVVGGPGTTVVACLGAAEVDRHGNLNSTELAGGRFLVGSGGGNDVASRAAACVVVTLARPERLPADAAYVTSPGERVTSVVTDLGVLRRLDGVLRVAAVPAGEGPLADRVRDLVGSCGWDPEVAATVEELPPVSEQEVLALREYDRQRLFLS